VLQLNLRKPKKQKGKAPPPLEFASHVFVADTLRRWCNPQWEWTHLPLGEKRHIGTALRLKRMGVRPGFPDFLFAGPNEKLVWLELKRRGNKLSPAQEKIEAHLRQCGFDYLVADNVRDAVAWLRSFGILPDTIKDVV